MLKTSILNRLIVIFFSLIASSLIFFSVYMLDIFNNYSLNAIKENLHITIKNVQFFLMQPNNKEYLQQATIKPYLTELAKVNNINIHILDIDKNLLVSSATTTPDLNSFENLASLKTDFNKINTYTRKNTQTNENYIYMATSLPVDYGQYVILISANTQSFNQNFQQIRQITFIALLITCIIALFVSIKFAKNIISPLQEITTATEAFSSGKFEHKLQISTQDEFGLLAHTINTLAANLADKITETALEKTKLKLILEKMDNAVILVDQDGRIQTINQKALSIFPINKFTNSDTLHHLDILSSSVFDKAIQDTINNNNPQTIDLKLKFKEQAKSFQVFLSPITEVYSNKIKYVLCVFYDITALKSIFDKQVDFIANASHELSTPLTSIRGFAEAIEDDADNSLLVNKFAKIIQEESLRMQRLINDLLQIAKLDSSEYRNTITLSNINIENLLPSIVTDLSNLAQTKNIELNIVSNLNNNLIYSNYDWLKQALVNLVENAIKYTPAGGKVFLILEEDNAYTYFKIKDTGEGMPNSELEKIFDRFYRVDKARSRSSGGTGLGLSIVKFITKLLAAKIKVESTVGLGTTFTISIPKPH